MNTPSRHGKTISMALAALLVTALAAQGHAASGQSGKHPAARPSGIQHGALWLPRAVIREIRKAGVQPAIPPTWLPPVGGWLHGRRVTSAWPIVGAVAPNNGYLVDTSSREDVDESDIAFLRGQTSPMRMYPTACRWYCRFLRWACAGLWATTRPPAGATRPRCLRCVGTQVG